ncbi:MAG: hypothetical protein KDD41_13235 [Flavobacteriales bacterium]|nr:hypothetical protein [Flavobacteriales bacterium]
MKNFMLYFVLVSTILSSCSKEKNSPVSPSVPNNQSSSVKYIPLAVGNYWVYETYSIDTLNNKTLISVDSAYVSNTITINGHSYYVLDGDPYAINAIGSPIRNSHDSVIFYDSGNFQEHTLFTSNHLGQVYSTSTLDNGSPTNPVNLMELDVWTNPKKTITTSLGSFSCFERQTRATPLVPYPHGVRNFYTYYYESIGVLVNEFFFFSSPNKYESRLVRYHLN